MSGKTYQVGTLTYTFQRLCIVFFWMLWGALAMNMLNLVFRKSTPFIFEAYGLSDTFKIMLLGTTYSLMNVVMNPILSFNSDRCRSRWGRRIPFILFTAVPLGLAMAATPFYPYLTKLLPPVSVMGFTFNEIFFYFGGVIYCFFWLFIGALYFYMIPDVIPVEMMGRYYGFFRVAGVISGIVVNKFAFVYSLSHPQIVFPLIAVVYVGSIFAMCTFVKEGKYPEPEKLPPRTAWYIRLWNSIKTYSRDCFSERYYWGYYMIGFCTGIAGCVFVFADFFYKDACKMTTAQIGDLGMWLGVVGFVTCLTAGFLVDKFGAIQSQIVALAMMALFYFLGGMFIKDYTTALVWRIPFSVFSGIYAVAGGKVLVEVFPRSRFGQFASAQAMFISLTVALVNYPVGKLSDYLKRVKPEDTLIYWGIDWLPFLRGYRFTNYWCAFFYGSAMLVMLYFYVHFQRKRKVKAVDL